MWKHYLKGNFHNPPKYAVPMLADSFNKLPALTLIVCELDPFKDEGKLYAEKLEKESVPVCLIEISGALHAFDFFSCQLSESFQIKQITLFKQILKTL